LAKAWQMSNAALFLQALQSRQKEIPNLISAHLGNRVPQIPNLQATAAAPADPKQNASKIAALPIGGRVKMDPWNDKLEMIKSKPIGTIAEREKMPFEVTPFMPYLMRTGPTLRNRSPPALHSSRMPTSRPSLPSHKLQQQDIFGPKGLSGRFFSILNTFVNSSTTNF